MVFIVIVGILWFLFVVIIEWIGCLFLLISCFCYGGVRFFRIMMVFNSMVDFFLWECEGEVECKYIE